MESPDPSQKADRQVMRATFKGVGTDRYFQSGKLEEGAFVARSKSYHPDDGDGSVNVQLAELDDRHRDAEERVQRKKEEEA